MFSLNLQLFGGRGSKSGGGGGGASSSGGSSSNSKETFSSFEELDKSLSSTDDPNYKDFMDAYNENSFENNIGDIGYLKSQAQTTGLGEWGKKQLEQDLKTAQSKLDSLPDKMTASQIGEQQAFKEWVDNISEVLSINPTEGYNPYDIDITT